MVSFFLFLFCIAPLYASETYRLPKIRVHSSSPLSEKRRRPSDKELRDRVQILEDRLAEQDKMVARLAALAFGDGGDGAHSWPNLHSLLHGVTRIEHIQVPHDPKKVVYYRLKGARGQWRRLRDGAPCNDPTKEYRTELETKPGTRLETVERVYTVSVSDAFNEVYHALAHQSDCLTRLGGVPSPVRLSSIPSSRLNSPQLKLPDINNKRPRSNK